MSGHNTRSRVLAVSFALIMLVSMGGTAFVGGAAAQSTTGGTFDQIFNDRNTNVGNQLALDSNSDATVINANSAGPNVRVQPDGRVTLPGTATEYTFDGLELSLDQVSEYASSDLAAKQTNGNYTGVLQDFPAKYNVSGGTGNASHVIPTILIELDPESDFSQIAATDADVPNQYDSVGGTHDYIIVAPANRSAAANGAPGSQIHGLVGSNRSLYESAGEVVAVSADNVASSQASSSLLANGSDFGATLDELTDGQNSTERLKDSNIDGITVAAGTFQSTTVNINEIKLDENNINNLNSVTTHSEKIALDNGTATTYHSSINGSLQSLTADGDDEVRLAQGTYNGSTAPELPADQGAELDISSNVTITAQATGSGAAAGANQEAYERVNTTRVTDPSVSDHSVFNESNEAIINTTLNITGSATVSNVGLNTSNSVVNITADDVTLDNLVINSTTSAVPAVTVNATAGTDINGVTNSTNGTIINGSAIVSDYPTEFTGGTGLDLNYTDEVQDPIPGNEYANIHSNFSDISDNYFIGFQTQVIGVNQSEATTIYRDQEAQFTNKVTDPVQAGLGQYNDSYLAQSAVPFSGGTVNATAAPSRAGKDNSTLNGSITDAVAGDDDVINVTGGTYAGQATRLTTPGVSIKGAGPGAVTYNGTGGPGSDAASLPLVNGDSIAVSGVNVNRGNITALGPGRSNVTIRDVDLSNPAANITVLGGAYSLTVDQVEIKDARNGSINFTDNSGLTGDLTVTDTTVTNMTGGTALNVSQPGFGIGTDVTVRTFDVTTDRSTVNQYTGSVDGINLSDIGPNGSVNITESSLTGLGNGVGIRLNQSYGDSSYSYSVNVSDNTLTSTTGSSFTGIIHDLPNVTADQTAADVEAAIDYDDIANGEGPFFDMQSTPPRTGSFDELLLKKGKTLRDIDGVKKSALNGTIEDNTITGVNTSAGEAIVITNGTASQFNSRATSISVGQGGSGAITINTSDNSIEPNVIASYGTNTTTQRVGSDINSNTLSGFARVVESKANVSASAFDTIESSNTIGTLVYGTGTDAYATNFGSGRDAHSSGPNAEIDGYIPGSVAEALNLVNTSLAPTSTLEVNDPTTVGSGPQYYNESQILTFPDSDGVTLQGQNGNVEVRGNVSIAQSGAKNNHAIRSLTIDHTDANVGQTEPALHVTSNNAQAVFANLTVESNGEGLNVTADTGDVNVIELRDSVLNVAGNGTVLAAGSDDRDGFVINNTVIRNTDSTINNGDVGLNLTALDQPGEADESRTDLTGLQVTGNYITGFETQVTMPENSEANITALNFTAEAQWENSFDIDSQLSNNSAINLGDNRFGQQVLVFNTTPVENTTEGTADPDVAQQRSDFSNISLNKTDIYGSVDAAAAAAGDSSEPSGEGTTNVTVRVYDSGEVYSGSVQGSAPSSPTLYEENVDINNNVTVRGASYNSFGTDTLSSPATRLNGTLTFGDGAGNGTVTQASEAVVEKAVVTGFTITADDTDRSAITEIDGGGAAKSVGAGNITIANTTISVIGNSTTGLPESMTTGVRISNTTSNLTSARGGATGEGDTPRQRNVTRRSDINLTGLYIGDHNAVQTVNTSVIVDTNVSSVSISNSEFVGSTPATGNETFNGTGLNVTRLINGSNAEISLTDTTVQNFTQEGLNVSDDTSSSVAANANRLTTILSNVTVADNGDSRSQSSPGINATGYLNKTVVINQTSTISGNEVGIRAANDLLTLNLNNSAVSAQNGTTAGVSLGNVTNQSSINGTSIVDNRIGLQIGSGFGAGQTAGLDVTNNNFTNEIDIDNDAALKHKFNATLNYFGDYNATVRDAGGVTTVYDPFLSQDLTGQYPTDVSATKNFGHDIDVPANTAITVGFPATPESTNGDDAATVSETFRFSEIRNNDNIALYNLTYNNTNNTAQLQALEDPSDGKTEITAQDAFVLWNQQSSSFSGGAITYEDPIPSSYHPTTYDRKGVHFVAPTGYGNASDVLVDGTKGDVVASGQVMGNGTNLYGVADQTNATFDESDTPEGELDDTFVRDFGSGVGTQAVHPHRGYFVIVNEDSTVSTMVPGTGTITTGSAPTAANINTKLNQTSH